MMDLTEKEQLERSSETPVSPDAAGYRELWHLAYPIILANISETLMGATDTFMVAQLGKVEVAAVGLGSMMAWLFYLPFLGLAMGVNTFVAQQYGARAYEDCGRMTWQGLYIAVASGALIMLGILLAPTLFALAKPSEEVQRLGTLYLQYRLIDGAGLTIGMTVASLLRGIGDTRTPMKIGIGINALNILFNYALIYGHFGLPRLEVQGSAIGSAAAGLIGGGVYLILLFRPVYKRYGIHRLIPPSRYEIRRLMWVGGPIGIQRFLDIGSFVIFSAMIGRLGDAQLAANQIAIQLMSIAYMFGLGISIAATVLVGQYIGAKRLDLAERSAYTALKLAMIYMSVIGVFFLFFPEEIMGFFNDDPDVVRYGRQGLMMAAFFQALDACGVVLIGALRGAGDTRWSMMAALIGAWVIFLPLSYILAIPMQMGFLGAWIGATIYICGLGVACLIRFRQGVWKGMTI